jgi:hypothetical protein
VAEDLLLLLYYGIYFIIGSSIEIRPASAICIITDRVPVTLLNDAISNIVSFCINGAVYGKVYFVNLP